MTTMEEFRSEYHRQICEKVLFLGADDVPSNADKHSQISVALAKGIVAQLAVSLQNAAQAGQTSGNLFEQITASYLEKAFGVLQHLRPGNWIFSVSRRIEDFEQYEHLAELTRVLQVNKALKATLGDYLIKPDIVIGREPVDDVQINQSQSLVPKEKLARLTPLRAKNSPKVVLHASISCKWTIRSDRSQNARTEGLNLIRNRKGKTPHIVVVTAEPYPQRIASLALGTGDIDCVYHIALPELEKAVEIEQNAAVTEMLDTLVSGKRLRDISDLPFDLAI